MAGHSKWANIQHRKNAQDKKRGKIFSKLIREITVAARMGGGDIDANPRLRLAVDKAYASNMAKDTVDRAIKRGAGGLDGDNVEDITYEGYGASGVAVLVKCMSDNRNRTVAEVRHVFSKCGGNLGTDGSVAYLFKEQGQITFPPESDEEKIIEVALDANADDVIVHDDQSIDVITTPEEFATVKQKLDTAGLQAVNAEIVMDAAIKVPVASDKAEKVVKLIDMLEDLDDVQEVFSNADLPDDF
jgi:YebC/PmpR family DNA-binding regulatory protein